MTVLIQVAIIASIINECLGHFIDLIPNILPTSLQKNNNFLHFVTETKYILIHFLQIINTYLLEILLSSLVYAPDIYIYVLHCKKFRKNIKTAETHCF